MRLCLICLAMSTARAAEPEWTSPDRQYRVLLAADPGELPRSLCPVRVEIDFPALLDQLGGAGTFDEHTIEVVGYDPAGHPRVFDPARSGYEKWLLPWRMQNYYGIQRVTLSFVMPDQGCLSYAVYLDTKESGVGRPDRYRGLVGDGDWFREGFRRREINACHFDQFSDLDGDGDLDLFKGGVEPFVFCYENVGGNRFVERGRLTSGGEPFMLPNSGPGANRSWMTVAFHDWDGDGDQDFFPSFGDGPDRGLIVFYRNTTRHNGGQLTFTRVGPLTTVSGTPLAGGSAAGGWFPAITFAPDWDGDGDGRFDVLVASNNHCHLYRNLGPDGAGGFRLADPVAIQAGGADIELTNPRFDCADVDSDGDLDLFAGTQQGHIYFFENVDTSLPRTQPTFAAGRMIAFENSYYISDAHSGVKVADFTGDGLLDFVVGRFWERTGLWDPEQPREYGWLYENVGTAASPQFEKRDANQGAPYTEQFQRCDAVRQNGVRCCDWNSDGRPDLIAGDTDGFVWYFRNEGSRLSPVFATGEKLRAAGEVLSVNASGGHARHEICDWNNDGRKDLIVADGHGWITLFLNEGTDADPLLSVGQRVKSNGVPIDRGSRSSVLVCDWNNDGRKDVVFADQEDGFVWFRNVGSDADPVLAAAQSFGLAMYTRPNLGSFVDWDGDGRKDFIGCNFENEIRFYRNIGSGQAGATPVLTPPDGAMIVGPWSEMWSIMMISGADAVDFNGDGDVDILTGQGHGGSGLRFFERDFIDNQLNNTHPTVTILGPGKRPAAGDFDGDNDVDQEDFGRLQGCLSGPGWLAPPGCEDADLDFDLDIDGADVMRFLECANGAMNAPRC